MYKASKYTVVQGFKFWQFGSKLTTFAITLYGQYISRPDFFAELQSVISQLLTQHLHLKASHTSKKQTYLTLIFELSPKPT